MLSTGGIVSHDGNWTTHTFLGSGGMFTSGFDGEIEINTFTEKVNRTFKRWVTRGEQVSIAPVSDLAFFGNAGYSTAQKKFGNGSYYFDGTGDFVTIADSPDFEVGATSGNTNDFGIEAWIYPTSNSGAQSIIAKRTASTVYGAYTIVLSGGVLTFYSSSTGVAFDISGGVTFGTPTLNTWSHIYVGRDGSTWRTFLNGVAGQTSTSGTAPIDSTQALAIGGLSDGQGFVGHIDEVKISKGSFGSSTPPTQPYTQDSSTKLLLHAEQGTFSVRYRAIQPKIFAVPTVVNKGFQFGGL